MGLDHNAYVGPYVRVTKTITKGQGDHCKDHNRGDAAFCPQCGKSKKDRIYTFEDNGAPDDWEEEYEKGSFYDYLTSTSFMSAPDLINGKRIYIYLPNRYHKELNIPSIDGGKYSEEIAFDEIDVAGTIKKFKTLFKDELAYLKKWFEVEVKFGYVSYCS